MAAHPGTYSSLCKSYFTPAVPELSRLRPRDEWDARDIVTEVSEVQVVAQLLQGVTSIAGHARLLDKPSSLGGRTIVRSICVKSLPISTRMCLCERNRSL